MKKIKRTKKPSMRQINYMVENLTKRMNNSYNCCIDIMVSYGVSGLRYSYFIHSAPGNKGCFSLNTWTELLDKYERLMKENRI